MVEEKSKKATKRACSFIREFRVHNRSAGTGQLKFETKIWKCSGSKKKLPNSFKTVTFSGFEASRFTLSRPVYISHRGVGDGWAGCAIAHPAFDRSVNPISTRGGRLPTQV